jgi:phosphate transport system permease protein
MDERLLRKVKRRDKVARWAITGGGVLIIVTVIGILFLIAGVAVPLFFEPEATRRVTLTGSLQPGSAAVLAVGTDEYLETAYLLTADGTFTFLSLPSGEVLERVRIEPPAPQGKVVAAEVSGQLMHSLTWEDGSSSVEQVVFAPRFDAKGERTISRKVVRRGLLKQEPGQPKPLLAAAVFSEERGLTRAAVFPGNRLAVVQAVSEEDLFGNKTQKTLAFDLEDSLPGTVRTVALDQEGSRLFAGTGNGHLAAWDLSEPGEPQLLGLRRAFADRRAVTTMAVIPGSTTVAVGDAQGGVSTWFPVRIAGAQGGQHLVMNHALPPRQGAVKQILPALQTRTLASLDESGAVNLDQVTAERALLRLTAEQPLRAIGVSTRFNILAGMDDDGTLTIWELDIPHPEAGWRTYFSKIWYGSYQGPAFVWQSSAGEDDFEPKLSLVPLVFGTLKGTFYGMLFAVPLALLGAMYTSHLMQVNLRKVVKPAVEIMGSMPSVVIGFLAALWLAPIVKASLLAIFLVMGLLPLAVLLTVVAWEWIGRRVALARLAAGHEFLVLGPVLVVLVFLCFQLGGVLERAWFDGNLTLWLFQHLGVQFDQRNSVVIAFALGFAVIPSIFTLADDALSNVPRNLTAASLALGASRWQTVWRVVLPSASPGIFAALMIGLGRAVGETMIVLMATGNTPIMSWSPFNGMRTLSANIAVEIPEAPLNSTLYRTLFLSAVLLFLFTFMLNSAAELVRDWLRGKYGRY